MTSKIRLLDLSDDPLSYPHQVGILCKFNWSQVVTVVNSKTLRPLLLKSDNKRSKSKQKPRLVTAVILINELVRLSQESTLTADSWVVHVYTYIFVRFTTDVLNSMILRTSLTDWKPTPLQTNSFPSLVTLQVSKFSRIFEDSARPGIQKLLVFITTKRTVIKVLPCIIFLTLLFHPFLIHSFLQRSLILSLV